MPRDRTDGCVTNFDHGEGKVTIWKSGDRFTLAPFGVFQELHPWTYEAMFQSIAKEMHRLAFEAGRLRRREIDIRRELLYGAPAAIADALMVNGSGERAERLVLEGANSADLGGWCRSAVEDASRGALRAALNRVCPEQP